MEIGTKLVPGLEAPTGQRIVFLKNYFPSSYLKIGPSVQRARKDCDVANRG